MEIKQAGSEIVKEITKKEFFRLCKGSKRVSVEGGLPSPAPYANTITTYKTIGGNKIYKIETLGLKTGIITIAYYKEAQ